MVSSAEVKTRLGLAIVLLLTLAPSVNQGQPNETAACLAIFNEKRAELTLADGIPRPPLVMNEALVSEAKRHIQEMKSHHYIADLGWSKVEPPWGYVNGQSPWVNMSLRACNDDWAAGDPPYPCDAVTANQCSPAQLPLCEDHAVTGWVVGVSANVNREARVTCKVWLDPRFPDWKAITNPDFTEAGIDKSGTLWSTFLGWRRQ